MGFRYRYTMKELNEWSDYDLLGRLVYERQSDCTNVYSPLYKRLAGLKNTLEKRQELTGMMIHTIKVKCLKCGKVYTRDCDSLLNYKTDGTECKCEGLPFKILKEVKKNESKRID